MSQAQKLANQLWQLLPVVGADNTAVIYEAVEYLEDIAREEQLDQRARSLTSPRDRVLLAQNVCVETRPPCF